MQCHEFVEYTERWMEGERAVEAVAHLEACTRCHGLVTDLNAIETAAHELETEVEPPARLWTAIRGQLESEGVIRDEQPTWTERIASLFDFVPRPALATAYLAAVVGLAMLVSYQEMQLREPVPGLSGSVAMARENLRTIAGGAESAVHEHNPAVEASYRESLKTVDSFILQCETMVRDDPKNELAREYLYGAYQQKAELLTAMAERGALGE